ncbi:tail fiber domain-containing protein [Psychroserpens sp. AS72]|uniref:tail fiber domain-containing protein n=1 Tax=Psychroserpens sp. AS72 TaxID=3135775 RepID=UPI00317C18B6
MKGLKIFITILLISAYGYSQNGINYKAVIKDTNGNVVANQNLDFVFNIEHENVSIYSESQQIMTDNNGIAIATIGNGSPSIGTFDTIDWKLRNLELNVQIDLGDGYVDFGNSPFNAVPYAINTLKPQGLKALNQGNGIGWRISNDSEPGIYGNIGGHAIDFSAQSLVTNRGATGLFSFASGAATIASATYSVAFGGATSSTGEASFTSGSYTRASESNSTAMGYNTEASGSNSFAIGNNSEASGYSSTAMGSSTLAEAYISTAVGRYNVGGGNETEWLGFDPLFEVGNGTSNSARRNALTIAKNGQHTINSEGIGLLISEAVNPIVISDSQANSIDISNSGFIGIRIDTPFSNGISILNAQQNGISASAINIGGNFSGGNVGVYARASNHNNPDIILGGSSGNANDDGIISSNPEISGSDIYLRSNDAVVIQLDYDDTNNSSFIVRDSDDVNVFSINESGNATLSGSLTQNSDRRLKKDIDDLQYGLNEILQLKPKQYYWKKAENQNTKSLGLIAQDVQPIIKEIVTAQDNAEKTLGISYNELIPVLINAIKEQQQIINSQKKDISELKNEVLKTSKSNYEALLSRIEDLEANQSN